jgi:hypothetical protein
MCFGVVDHLCFSFQYQKLFKKKTGTRRSMTCFPIVAPTPCRLQNRALYLYTKKHSGLTIKTKRNDKSNLPLLMV